jgi:hypothetical protein
MRCCVMQEANHKKGRCYYEKHEKYEEYAGGCGREYGVFVWSL